MNKAYLRFTLVALLSLIVYGASYYWYKSTLAKGLNYGNQKPVAFVSEINEEVHRRPVTRLLWQLLEQGEPLYPGEAIRTSKQGEIRIQFAESERYLDLEPESMIVITQSSNNEISLDLMDGNLFVAQGGKGDGPALTLNSEGGKVDLSKATAQLSKNKGSKLDVQVLKGKANIDGQEIDASQKLGFEILSPTLDRPFYINPDSAQPVSFQWRGAPANSTVSLWVGKNRKDLKFIAQIQDPNMNVLEQKLGLGKYFFKLVAKDPSDQIIQESSVYRFEVEGRYSPAQIAPRPEAIIQKAKPEELISFQWTRPEQSQSVILELAKDTAFKQKILSETISDKESFEKALPPGNYYWRVSSNYEGIAQPISSKILHFTISTEAKPAVVISWLQPMDQSPQYYVEKPQANLAWATEQKDQVKLWRLRIAENMEDLDSTQSLQFETKDPNYKPQVQKPGRYIAMVEALDEKQNVIAKSEAKNLEISPLPLLKAPLFQPEEEKILRADNQGRLELKWSEIQGAKEYSVSLQDLSGNELKKGRFRSTSTALLNLLPGEYKIQVFAIDQYDREGEKAEARPVNVSEMSGLKAPKLKKVKVK